MKNNCTTRFLRHVILLGKPRRYNVHFLAYSLSYPAEAILVRPQHYNVIIYVKVDLLLSTSKEHGLPHETQIKTKEETCRNSRVFALLSQV